MEGGRDEMRKGQREGASKMDISKRYTSDKVNINTHHLSFCNYMYHFDYAIPFCGVLLNYRKIIDRQYNIITLAIHIKTHQI
jgi:hypothetical protein